MKISILTIELRLLDCRSLKEKRSRVSGIKQRFGRHVNIAVCESDHHDVHTKSEWTFVITSTEQKVVDKTVANIESWLHANLDATVVSIEKEMV